MAANKLQEAEVHFSQARMQLGYHGIAQPWLSALWAGLGREEDAAMALNLAIAMLEPAQLLQETLKIAEVQLLAGKLIESERWLSLARDIRQELG